MMFKQAIVVSFCVALFIISPSQREAPAPAETTRDIWPPGFRPAAAKPVAKPGAAPRRDRYRRATPALPADAQAADNSVLGVTIWRLRLAKESDETRILVTKGGRKTPFTPERVEADTPFVPGQMMRLSIEVPRSGYLYVIDREAYADGSLSDPYLIFPLDLSRADHRVEAGRVIEIPNQVDPESYFEIKSYRGANQPDQTGEVLTLLVTPTPLAGLQKALTASASELEPIKLMPSQVSDWEKKWSVKTERLELEGGAGMAYTRAEQTAGKSREGRLTADDPPPQTVFRVAATGNQPLLVKISLRIAKK